MSRAHSPTFPSLYLRHNSFSNSSVPLPKSQLILNPSVASPTSQFILQTVFRFSYEQSSVSKLSVTSPTSQLILQPFRRFTYITARSPTLLSLLLRHGLFTYVTWRAAHASMIAIMMMIMNVHHFNKCINLNLRGFRSVWKHKYVLLEIQSVCGFIIESLPAVFTLLVMRKLTTILNCYCTT